MNNAEKTFLARFKSGPARRTVREPWKSGFIWMKYDDEGQIEQTAWVRDRHRSPKGDELQLWFMWINDMVTFKTENGLSGSCWSSGYVNFGTVYDDDGDSGPGEKIALDAWIDQCIEKMADAGKSEKPRSQK